MDAKDYLVSLGWEVMQARGEHISIAVPPDASLRIVERLESDLRDAGVPMLADPTQTERDGRVRVLDPRGVSVDLLTNPFRLVVRGIAISDPVKPPAWAADRGPTPRLDRPKRVALIGTSASPLTNGHRTMALEVLALTDVDEVWFLIAGSHPWAKKLMPAAHRVEMARMATERDPRIRVSDYEVVHGARVYAQTRETAFILRDFLIPEHPNHQFMWVMGSDVAQTFDQWGGHGWMAENVPCIIIHRLGYDFDKAASPLAHERHVYLKDRVVTSNISSSLVRERGRNYDHNQVVSLVCDEVWRYLVKHRLLDEGVLQP